MLVEDKRKTMTRYCTGHADALQNAVSGEGHRVTVCTVGTLASKSSIENR